MEERRKGFILRDLTGKLEDQFCETRELAYKQVEHLFEWQPASRIVVIPEEIDPSAEL